MTEDRERQLRRTFQQLKSMSNEKFWAYMNWAHTRAYASAVKHYTEAAEIVLPPRLQKQLHAKAEEIRTQWDQMATITMDETEDIDFHRVMGWERKEEKSE